MPDDWVYCHPLEKGDLADYRYLETIILKNPKQAASDVLKEMPDDKTFEDIMYQIYVLSKIEKGLKEADQGNLISQDGAEKEMEKWLKE